MGTSIRSTRWTAMAFDVGFSLVAVLGLALTAFMIGDTWGGGYALFDAAAALGMWLLALARRVHRAWVAIAGLVVAAAAIAVAEIAHLPQEPGPVAALALAVLIGSAIRSLPLPWAGGIAAGGLAVVIGCWISGGFKTIVVLLALAWLGAIAAGVVLRLIDQHRHQTAEEIRRNERLALARELHDIVAHHITGIVLQAQAGQLVASGNSAKLVSSLAGIEVAGSDALAAMRRVVGLLRDTDDAAPASPGPEQLSDLIERFSRYGGPTIQLRKPVDDMSWPPELTSTVYRIVQESLTNISRHAPQARSVAVTVEQGPETIIIEVVDDAAPATVRYPHRSGYGLIGMRERLQTLGGTLHAGPRPDAGWAVLATLPVPPETPRGESLSAATSKGAR
ncbi:sensor histidine kinase [Micromonospora sp. NPDC003197]